VANLNIKAWATTGAILWGVYLSLAALFAKLGFEALWFSREIFGLSMTIYPGLAATGLGIVIGLLWGLFCGAVCGGLFSWLHNWCSKNISWCK